MGIRPLRSFTIAATVASTVAAIGIWALPASAIPAQEPGVTLRVFDLQTPLSAICTLKTGRRPTSTS